MGRIDEVQKRLDDLERERNELLRYSFIQNEIKKFEAIKISNDITQLNKKVEETSVQADKVRRKVDKFRELRENRRSKRREIESESLAQKSWKKAVHK
jgi:chromosome segregation ATPase